MTFRNYKAAFLWGFMTIFLAFVAAMTWALFKEAPAESNPLLLRLLLLGFFWTGGLGGAAYATTQPCITVTVNPAGLNALWLYPFSRRCREVAFSAVTCAAVYETTDSDGDPYFHARVTLNDGTFIDLFEGHHRPDCVAVLARYEHAARGDVIIQR